MERFDKESSSKEEDQFINGYHLDDLESVKEDYFANGTLKYLGEWKYDTYHGTGQLYYYAKKKQLKYCGDFRRGKPNGWGTWYSNDGMKEKLVQTFDNAFHGAAKITEYLSADKSDYTTKYVIYYDGHLIYEGELNSDDEMHGEGIMYDRTVKFGKYNKATYGEWYVAHEGTFKKGKFVGYKCKKACCAESNMWH